MIEYNTLQLFTHLYFILSITFVHYASTRTIQFFFLRPRTTKQRSVAATSSSDLGRPRTSCRSTQPQTGADAVVCPTCRRRNGRSTTVLSAIVGAAVGILHANFKEFGQVGLASRIRGWSRCRNGYRAGGSHGRWARSHVTTVVINIAQRT